MQAVSFVLFFVAVMANGAVSTTVRLGPLPYWFQSQIKILGTLGKTDLAYFPTVAPAHYTWGGSGADACESAALLQDTRYRASIRQEQTHSVKFSVDCFAGPLSSAQRGNPNAPRRDGEHLLGRHTSVALPSHVKGSASEDVGVKELERPCDIPASSRRRPRRGRRLREIRQVANTRAAEFRSAKRRRGARSAANRLR